MLIHYKDNVFYHYTTENSDLPDNNINCLTYNMGGGNGSLIQSSTLSANMSNNTPGSPPDLGIEGELQLGGK